MDSKQPFRVGLVQMAMSPRPGENLDHAVARVADAAEQGAQIVCLPELFRTHYPCQVEDQAIFDWAETIPGPSTEALGRVARDKGITIVASLFEHRSAGLYHNTAAVIGADGQVAGLYRKMHIPDDPGYYEKFYFTPGDLGFGSFQTPVGRIGVLVCWDQWFPEAARLTALTGPTILFYPTAIGWLEHERAQFGQAQRDAWQTVQRGHAIANGLYVAAVNRVGRERWADDQPDVQFWGGSFVADPFGRVVAEAGEESQTLLATLEPDLVEQTRREWPFLRDRRVESYGDLQQRWLGPREPRERR